MKNLTTVLLLVLLAATAALLWRFDRHLAPLAELARVQLADRAEARQAEKIRLESAARQQAAADAAAKAEAQRRQAEEATALQAERAAAARVARLREPVKSGEVVEAIVLDNHATINGAVVVAVQPTSVSFRAGAQLYNIPTDQLPEELRTRVQHMFPAEFPSTALPPLQ